VPAIKGDMYINTHCNYSQPTLIKLDNKNIGGHLTPLHSPSATSYPSVHGQTADVFHEAIYPTWYSIDLDLFWKKDCRDICSG